MEIADVAIKAAPESVGLAWMGVRICLHLVRGDFAIFQLVSRAGQDIVDILMHCRVFSQIYVEHKADKVPLPPEIQETQKVVVSFISGIFVQILDFQYKTKKHVEKNFGCQ